MEGLIRQAFMHVELVGPHVMEGHFDLIGPDGEIILPTVWETIIKPDFNIEMQMWPLPELERAKAARAGPPGVPGALPDLDALVRATQGAHVKKGKGGLVKPGKHKGRAGAAVVLPHIPPPMATGSMAAAMGLPPGAMMPPPPPMPPAGLGGDIGPALAAQMLMPGGVEVVDSKKKKKRASGMAGFFAGARRK